MKYEGKSIAFGIITAIGILPQINVAIKPFPHLFLKISKHASVSNMILKSAINPISCLYIYFSFQILKEDASK